MMLARSYGTAEALSLTICIWKDTLAFVYLFLVHYVLMPIMIPTAFKTGDWKVAIVGNAFGKDRFLLSSRY